MLSEQESLLYNELIKRTSLEKFEQIWLDEISDPADEVCVEVKHWKLPKLGRCSVYVLRGGLCAVEDARGRWSAYESEARVSEREYYASWARFCRGTWTLKVPQQEGLYLTKTLEGTLSKVRTLTRVGGRLKDTTCCGGFVPYAEVTSWRAYWFEYPLPPIRGAV